MEEKQKMAAEGLRIRGVTDPDPRIMRQVPPYLQEAVKNRVRIMAAEGENGECRGLLIFVPSNIHKDEAILRHFAIDEEFRESRLFSRMMKTAVAGLKMAGIKTIYCRLAETPKDAVEKSTMLMDAGFLALNLTGRLLTYEAGELYDLDFYRTILPRLAADHHVYTLAEAPKSYKDMIFRSAAAEGYRIEQITCDPQISTLFIYKKKPRGFLLAERMEGGELLIHTSYFAAKCGVKKGRVFGGLLAGTLSRAQTGERPEGLLHIRSDTEEILELTRFFLGTGDEERILQELLYIIR